MNEWLDIIEYKDFHDVPRVFLVDVDGRILLFDCPFDDELDEYPDEYQVYEMNENFMKTLSSDWTKVSRQAVRCSGTVAVCRVMFDSTKRRKINGGVLSELLS